MRRPTEFAGFPNQLGEHFKQGARKSRGVVHLIGWAASWNTILSPKLIISTFGFAGFTRCSGGAFSADLHAVLQIGFDWTDFHLHRFRIRKKDYAVPRRGGLGCHDARQIKLGQLHFRINERFSSASVVG